MKFLLIMLTCIIGSRNTVISQPVKISNKAFKPSVIKKIKVSTGEYRYETPSGRVSVKLALNMQAKDDIKNTSTPVNTAMCLTKEEVNGQKIENELVIADGSKAMQILPGGVIDVDALLQSGQFVYIKMDKRKPVSFSTSSNLAKTTSSKVTPIGNENIESKLRSAVNQLTRPSNLSGMPNSKSESETIISTLQESTGLSIGASFFYMGISVDENFSYSSEKYRYMYLYRFEQECLPVIANTVSSPADVFTDNSSMNNWLYIREVKYGRRLYVLMESEYDLEKYSNELNGSLDWGVVAAAYSQKNTGSSLSSKTNIRIITQGGQPVSVTDNTKLQAKLDGYFNAKFSEFDIVPLSYKLTNLDGKPVSMVSTAFLNADNCLDKNKVRIRIKSIQCDVADDGGTDEQIYGSVSIYLYNEAKKLVGADGKTVMPAVAGVQLLTGAIIYAKEAAPLILQPGKPKEFDLNQQGKYLDLPISSLDMVVELRPGMKEKDDFGDDVYVTTNKMKKSIRQMLMEGSTNSVFEFRYDKSVIKLMMEITPLY